jgi:hypothetical protein
MYPIDTIGLLLIYGLGLIISYNFGKNNSKQHYFKLVNRLHLNYKNEMNPRSLLLSGLDDMEKLR